MRGEGPSENELKAAKVFVVKCFKKLKHQSIVNKHSK